jgi:integrase
VRSGQRFGPGLETFASTHLRRGTNLLLLSRALGHHSPAFTLTRYTHLLPGEEAPALDVTELHHL